MNVTKLLVLTTLLGLAALALPGELGVADTASANTCHQYLLDGDVKTWRQCSEDQCQWDDFPYGAPVCTD